MDRYLHGRHPNNLDEHKLRTKRILERLKKNDLYLKPEKCSFEVPQIDYLGMVISKNKIATDSAKLLGIRDWPTPLTVKGVRSFLGFGNFYRKFISHYLEIARPLNNLTKKNLVWKWSEECQKGFDTLKQKFGEAPVLLMPDTNKPFLIESDASKFASGAVLRQRDNNGDWHPCRYLSSSFDQTQRNYEIYDRELLGIIRALEAWRHYLLGSPYPVTIFSDHKNLTYFRTAQKLNRRQARWSLFLSQFDLKLIHVPGSQMVQSDALSRWADLCPEEDHNNEDLTLLPEKLFIRTINMELKNELARALMGDEVMNDALNLLREKGVPPIKSRLNEWRLDDGLLFFRDRCYVPPMGDLRKRIIQKYHNSIVAGHPGIHKTLQLVQEHYWWPLMMNLVKKYVDGCAACQQMKVNTHLTSPPLMPISSGGSHRPFAQVSTDFITDLPVSNGYDSIMVVVDHGLSKGVIYIPCNKTLDALGTVDLFFRHIYRRFGLPDKIISDRGIQFAAKVFQELGRVLGIKLAMSMAYHPQTDGETERVNQELEIYLRMVCANHPDQWEHYLSFAEFTHNKHEHSARKMLPFMIMYGVEPKAIPIPFPITNTPAIEKRIANLQRLRDEAIALHDLARAKMIARSTQGFTPFKINDYVWLESKNLKLGYQTKKLVPKREGPFRVEAVLGPLTYRLKLPEQWTAKRVHPVFHASLLTPFKENEIHGENYIRPPPDVLEGKEEYEVEAILNHRIRRGKLQYLVKWLGYSTAESTWEPEQNLTHAETTLDDYKKTNQL